MEKEYLTVEEVANILKVSKSKIYKDVLNGLPHYKVGSKLRFVIEEVSEYYKKSGDS